jgi:hypothetical protein
MTLEKVLDAAWQKIFFSPDCPQVAPDVYDQDWIDQKWKEFLEQRGISEKKKKGWVKVFPSYPLYIPPKLAEKMLVLGYLP